MLRKYWFYSLSLLHVIFDLVQLGCILYSVILTHQLVKQVALIWNYVGLSLTISFWFMSCINGIFILTYGFIYTNTIFGTFLFQQTARFCFLTLWIASTIWTKLRVNLPGFFDVFLLTGGILHTATWVALWVLFLLARFSEDPLLGQWTVNVEDLVSRAQPLPHKITFRGIRRPSSRKSHRVRVMHAPVRFMTNALFRRVHPVETRLYAFCQNLFAVGAIALILTRAIIFLTQLDNEKLPSRAMVGPCWESTDTDSVSVLVRHPNQRRLEKEAMPFTDNMTFQVAVAFRMDEFTNVYNTTTDQCNGRMMKTDYPGEDFVDWFWLYTCNNTRVWNTGSRWRASSPNKYLGFEYTINSRFGGNDSRALDLPSIWLIQGLQSPNLLTPYLAPPLIPTPGAHMVHSTHYSQRKFISSSPLRDAITGSKPNYNTIYLYPPSPVYSRPITSSGGSNTKFTYFSSGFIRWPKYLDSSLQTPRSDLTQGKRGPEELCEVIEEYRVGNTFDILASIGGLLALLQGLHIFLFGRPLFWGLFGAKLITPFGFVGRFATRGFRKRLQDHYRIPDSLNASTGEESADQSYNNMRMVQFLLDYVLDMGPASPPNRRAEEDPESLHQKMQQDDMNKPIMTVSQESIMTDSVHAQGRSSLPGVGKGQG